MPLLESVFHGFDIVDETQIQHSVGFVQDQGSDEIRFDVILPNQIEHAARSRDQNVHAAGELGDLRILFDTPVHRVTRGAGFFREHREDAADLLREFPSRHQNQTMNALAASFPSLNEDLVDDRNGEGRRLAAPCLRHGQDIFAVQNGGDGFELDIRCAMESVGDQVFFDLRVDLVFFEFHGWPRDGRLSVNLAVSAAKSEELPAVFVVPMASEAQVASAFVSVPPLAADRRSGASRPKIIKLTSTANSAGDPRFGLGLWSGFHLNTMCFFGGFDTGDMKHFALLLALLLFGCITSKPEDPPAPRSPSAYGEVGALSGEGDLSFAEMKRILEEKRFEKIDDLLEYLSRTKPNYMSHYTLGYASRSLHESSKEHPRAIVFGETGRFIITFNGHPNQAAYDMLEVVEFNQRSKKFEYREIQFNDLGQLGGEPFRISEVGGPGSKCLQCHTNSRPIWEAYPVWPGFYGADDDSPIGRSARGPALIPPKPGVAKDWEEFKRVGLNQGRYRYLSPMAESRIFAGYGVRPNSDLTELLTRMNMERIARLLKGTTAPDFRYAYLYAGRCYARTLNARRDEIRSGKEASVQVASVFEKLVAKHQARFSKKGFEHQVYKAGRLVADMQYEPKEFIEYKVDEYAQRHRNNSAIGVPPPNVTLQQLLELIVKESVSGLSPNVLVYFQAVAGLTSEFFPSARPETWSSALYEGVHIYHSGSGAEMTWLNDAIMSEFFTPVEREALLVGEKSDWRGFCRSLEAKFPPRLKAWEIRNR